MSDNFLSKWQDAQAWEQSWHGTCTNSLNEEQKQIVYAEKMGLIRTPTPKTPYNFDLNGEKILDIGGGAYSLLLKCVNYAEGTVVADPLMDKHPKWVIERYKEVGIEPSNLAGEDILMLNEVFDTVLIYNVLEHVLNPQEIIHNARKVSKVIRIFEWVGTRLNEGHIHSLKEKDLNEWLGGEGKVEVINRGGAVGKCYYGVFKGDLY